jgi:hypothetical protein
METLVLIVMEHASEWPSHINGGVAGCVAMRQEPDESHGDLLRRTYQRMRSIERAGGSVEVAVLSCSDDPSRGALEGRVPLARALLGTVLRGGRGRLDLTGRSSAPDRTRRSLIALAGTLTEALVGTSASVSARFSGASAVEPLSRRRRRLPQTDGARRSAA